MKQLTNEHSHRVLNYLLQEPEFNLFMIGDIEIYGLEDSHVSVYTGDDWEQGDFPYILLCFMGKYCIYSHCKNYDIASAASFIIEQGSRDISGKADIAEMLLPCLPAASIKRTFMSRLNHMSVQPEENDMVCRLTKEHVKEIYELYLQIEELENYHRMTSEHALESILQNLEISGRTYGLFVTEGSDRRLVSVASTAAETSRCAMIIGVATLAEYRGHGYASTIVKKLCSDCLRDGKQFLCLFYDNPAAGRIYHQIGFEELGLYTMLHIIE